MGLCAHCAISFLMREFSTRGICVPENMKSGLITHLLGNADNALVLGAVAHGRVSRLCLEYTTRSIIISSRAVRDTPSQCAWQCVCECVWRTATKDKVSPLHIKYTYTIYGARRRDSIWFLQCFILSLILFRSIFSLSFPLCEDPCFVAHRITQEVVLVRLCAHNVCVRWWR